MKKGIVLSLALILVAGIAYGAPQDGFWSRLMNKLEKVTPSKKTSATTAVGGVRGAKNDDSADIYWKGKDKSSEMNEEEFQKFNLAIESKLKGDNDLALKQLEEFLSLYPNSSFRVEGLQAVEMIKRELAAAKNPPKVEPVTVIPENIIVPKEKAVVIPEKAAPLPKEPQITAPEAESAPVK